MSGADCAFTSRRGREAGRGGREGRREEGKEGGLTDRPSASGNATDGVFCDGDAAGLLLNQFLLDLELFHTEELREGGEGGREGGREGG